MAFDEGLLERVRQMTDESFEEKRMFGGLCFLDRGNMAMGIVGDELMVRVGKDAYEAALEVKGAREMDFTGRPMKGMVMVSVEGFDGDKALRAWIDRGVAFTKTLPAKEPKPKSAKKKKRAKKSG